MLCACQTPLFIAIDVLCGRYLFCKCPGTGDSEFVGPGDGSNWRCHHRRFSHCNQCGYSDLAQHRVQPVRTLSVGGAAGWPVRDPRLQIGIRRAGPQWCRAGGWTGRDRRSDLAGRPAQRASKGCRRCSDREHDDAGHLRLGGGEGSEGAAAERTQLRSAAGVDSGDRQLHLAEDRRRWGLELQHR